MVYFRSFSNKHYNFYNNICEKCPSSIRYWDLNPRPLGLESPPITTRPGLPPSNIYLDKKDVRVYVFRSDVTTGREVLCKQLQTFVQLIELVNEHSDETTFMEKALHIFVEKKNSSYTFGAPLLSLTKKFCDQKVSVTCNYICLLSRGYTKGVSCYF